MIRPSKNTESQACAECVLAKVVPDTSAYAVTREQLKAITDVREMAKRAGLRAGTNSALLDFALDVANRLRGL